MTKTEVPPPNHLGSVRNAPKGLTPETISVVTGAVIKNSTHFML